MTSDTEANCGRLSGSREPSPSCTGLGPSGFDPGRIAQKLSAKQFEALRLSGEGWPLSYYYLPGGIRAQTVGRPYWALTKGRGFDDVPKPPHWRVATSLQDTGLIEPDRQWALITTLGRQVLAIAMARDSAETACPAPVPQDCQARCEAIAHTQSAIE